MRSFDLTCQPNGRWNVPFEWPKCIENVECPEPPPPAPRAGTRKWSGKFAYLTKAEYDSTDLYRISNFDTISFSLPRYKCGHYARFKKDENSTEYETATIHCQWNKTWSLEELHPCSCKL